jgi:hypothetical protein
MGPAGLLKMVVVVPVSLVTAHRSQASIDAFLDELKPNLDQQHRTKWWTLLNDSTCLNGWQTCQWKPLMSTVKSDLGVVKRSLLHQVRHGAPSVPGDPVL